MSDDILQRRPILAAIFLFMVIAILISGDLLVDYREGASQGHLAVEFAVLLLTAAGIGFLLTQLRQTRSSLAAAQIEAEQWRAESEELMRGLGVAIEKQFNRWQLTQAEAEIGLLLLKGLSHKEIAKVRNTSERTTREQARALYRKSGLPGRYALSSFFLEDLLLPKDQLNLELN